MPSVAWTSNGGIAVGRTCRARIAHRAGPERASRRHVFEFARTQHLAANQSRIADPSDHREREHDVHEARAEHRDQRDGEQHARKRHQDVHDPADQLIDAAAVVARHRADDHPDDRRHADHDQPDEQGDPRAEQHARQDVPSQLVESEPVLPTLDPASDSADPAWPRPTAAATAPRSPPTNTSATIAKPARACPEPSRRVIRAESSDRARRT